MQGEIIAAKLPMGIEHYGVSTGCGTVVNASMRTGLVLEESEEKFSGGYPIISKGYPSTLFPSTVIAKAQNSIGQQWNLFMDNCQHFATWCHENKHSPQLQLVVSGALAVLALLLITKTK